MCLRVDHPQKLRNNKKLPERIMSVKTPSRMAARTFRSLNQRNEIDIDRRRMDATMLLVKAIGGGWDTTQLPKY
jgi:hypothetical protein